MRTPQRLPSGRYRVRFRHHDRQTSETFDHLRDANKFAKLLSALGPDRARAELYGNPTALADTPTLNTVAADHIRYLTGIEDGTRLEYSRLWARTWGPLLGHLPVDLVSRDHVKDAVNTLAPRYAEKSLSNQRGLLSAVLDRAVEAGHLPSNPAKGIRLPRGDHEPDEMTLLTHVDWQVLYTAMDPRARPLARFLAGTGARWGEAVVLRTQDVDLEQRLVRLHRGLKRSPDGNRKIGVTKTRRSKRTIYLPAEVTEDLRPLTAGRGADDLVFTAPKGGMIAHRHWWTYQWRPAIWTAQRCGEHLDPDCCCTSARPSRCPVHHGVMPGPCGCPGTLKVTPRIHDLRHTHASWLLAAGVPIHVVQARLGHESIKTTVDRYGHLLPDAQLAAAAAADRAFAVTPPPVLD